MYTLHNMRDLRINGCRSSGTNTGQLQFQLMEELSSKEMRFVTGSQEDVCKLFLQLRWFESSIWSTGGHRSCKEIFGLNVNNNCNSSDESDSGINGAGTEMSKAQSGFSKSEQTIETKSSHSYSNRRRSTKPRSRGKSAVAASFTDVVHSQKNPNVVMHCLEREPPDIGGSRSRQYRSTHFRDHMEAGASSESKQKCTPQSVTTSHVFASIRGMNSPVCNTDNANGNPSGLKDLFIALSSYKGPSDVPPSLKEQIFQSVFEPFLDGGYISDKSVLANLAHNPAINSPQSVQMNWELHNSRADPSNVSVQTVLFSPNLCVTTVPDDREGLELNGAIRESCTDHRSEKPKTDHPTEEGLLLSPRSPSFISLRKAEHSGSVISGVHSLGQQAHDGIGYTFGPVSSPRKVTHCEDDSYDHRCNEINRTPDEPFSSEYVFQMLFGSSFFSQTYYWHIEPPILPSRAVQYKVLEDGISDKIIGTGSFGVVLEAKLCVGPGQARNVVIKEHFMSRTTERNIIKEARICMYLESTGCIPICYGLLRDPVGNLSIVMELFGTGKSLYHLLDENTLPRVDWLNIACQLAVGLGRIHEKHILINDIKPDNILVKLCASVPHVKYCDMGSASFKSGVVYDDENMELYAHMAPEVRAYAETTKANDVYGLGRVIMKMYVASGITALALVYEGCMAEHPADRLSVTAMCHILTDAYRRELLMSNMLDGSSLPSSPEDSSLEPHPVQEEFSNDLYTCSFQNLIENTDVISESGNVTAQSSAEELDSHTSVDIIPGIKQLRYEPFSCGIDERHFEGSDIVCENTDSSPNIGDSTSPIPRLEQADQTNTSEAVTSTINTKEACIIHKEEPSPVVNPSNKIRSDITTVTVSVSDAESDVMKTSQWELVGSPVPCKHIDISVESEKMLSNNITADRERVTTVLYTHYSAGYHSSEQVMVSSDKHFNSVDPNIVTINSISTVLDMSSSRTEDTPPTTSNTVQSVNHYSLTGCTEMAATYSSLSAHQSRARAESGSAHIIASSDPGSATNNHLYQHLCQMELEKYERLCKNSSAYYVYLLFVMLLSMLLCNELFGLTKL